MPKRKLTIEELTDFMRKIESQANSGKTYETACKDVGISQHGLYGYREIRPELNRIRALFNKKKYFAKSDYHKPQKSPFKPIQRPYIKENNYLV